MVLLLVLRCIIQAVVCGLYSRTIGRNVAFFPWSYQPAHNYDYDYDHEYDYDYDYYYYALLYHHSYVVAEKFATVELTLCSTRMRIVKLNVWYVELTVHNFEIHVITIH